MSDLKLRLKQRPQGTAKDSLFVRKQSEPDKLTAFPRDYTGFIHRLTPFSSWFLL